ncbi:MAG: alpha/beta hydrolase [Gemmatimonadaceae bacterium]|nr:alpha/beta hydrolase [Gemmatimonadaceae bacterium]
MRGEFVDVGDARLYYYAAGTRGAGEPIVLLHGFPTSSHVWSRVVPLLPPGHRVVVLDLLGYGRSDRPGASVDLSIRGHADRVLKLMDALGINYAALVGHDLGGGIAIELALRAPARVSRLCLVDSVAFGEWPGREVRLARATLPLTRHLPGSWIGSILRADLLRGYASSEEGAHSVDQFIKPFADGEGVQTLVRHLESLDATETIAHAVRLQHVVVPTAIVWGADDPFLPVNLARRLHDAIPGSTIDLVPGGRHFLPEESPERVGDVVSSLLSR